MKVGGTEGEKEIEIEREIVIRNLNHQVLSIWLCWWLLSVCRVNCPALPLVPPWSLVANQVDRWWRDQEWI